MAVKYQVGLYSQLTMYDISDRFYLFITTITPALYNVEDVQFDDASEDAARRPD